MRRLPVDLSLNDQSVWEGLREGWREGEVTGMGILHSLDSVQKLE